MSDIYPDGGEPRKSAKPLLYVLGAAVLLGAGYFGYWTARAPGPEAELTKPATPEPTKAQETAQATATAQPEAPQEPAKPAGQAETPKTEAEAPQPQQKVTVESQPSSAGVPVKETAAPATPDTATQTEVAKAPAEQPAPDQQASLEPPAAAPAPEQAPAQTPSQAQEQSASQPPEEAPAQAQDQPVEQPAEQAKEQSQASPQETPQEQPQQQAAAPAAATAAPEPTPEPAAAEGPSFDTVRVEKDGNALIAGRAKPGADVMVKLNGQVVGKATAGADGSFVVIPDKPLPAGTGSLTLESDIAGKTVSSAAAVAVAIQEQAKSEPMVAVVKPDEPVKVIQQPGAEPEKGPSKQVVLDTVDYDADGAIVFSGRSTPGSTVRLYVDNALVGEIVVGSDGKWTFSGRTQIAPGTHALRADEVDAAGKVTSRVELPFQREEPEKIVAAAAPEQAKPQIGTKTIGNSAVPQRIVIQPGNNLWRLSRRVFGRGMQYTIIYEANKDQIRNPDLIYPGQVFAVPVQQ